MEASVSKENRIFFNHIFDKKRLKALISWVFKQSGEAEALRVIDLLKETGFRHATKAGISIGLHDLMTPIQKSWLISESQLAMNTTESDFVGARITATERSQRIIDTWHRASESLSKEVVDYFGIYDRFNPVYIMALSGARGNFSQVRQLIGMRGLMADQQGKIVNFPIRSNLREGLTLTEYFISCSGARKGLVDTALRTADTGYLTRRLVDVSHHVVVKRIRCNTNRGIAFKSLQSYNKVLLSLKERLVGRVLAEDVCSNDGLASLVKDKGRVPLLPLAPCVREALPKICVRAPTVQQRCTPLTCAKRSLRERFAHAQGNKGASKQVAKRDQEISLKLALKIAKVRDEVWLRSPLTCGFTHSVCQLCYGWSISQGSLVSLGDAVGVIAAQSIGEPGTQLTMRTFHTGGVFSGDLLQEIRAPHAGKIEFSKAFQGLLTRTAHGRIAFLSKTEGSLFLRYALTENKKNNSFTTIPIPAFTMLFVRQGEKVENNQLLAEFSIRTKEGNQPIKTQQTIFAQLSGKVVEDRSGKVYTKSIKESRLLLHTLESQDPSDGVKSNTTSTLAKKAVFCKQHNRKNSYKALFEGGASHLHRPVLAPLLPRACAKRSLRFVSPSSSCPSSCPSLKGTGNKSKICKGTGNKSKICKGMGLQIEDLYGQQRFNQMKKCNSQNNKLFFSQIRSLNVPHNAQNELLQNIFDTKLGRWGTPGKRFVFLNEVKKKQSPICKAQLFSLYKNEDLENDAFKYVEPVRSGRLGFLKILSTRVGATLDYISPIKSFDISLKKRKRRDAFEARFAESEALNSLISKTQQVGVANKASLSHGLQNRGLPLSAHLGVGQREQDWVGTLPFFSTFTSRYLHPEFLKDNRFFLQTIAEYGDIVEEGYSSNREHFNNYH